MLASKLDKAKVHMPTIMKPTKRVSEALQGPNPVFGAMLVNSSSKGFTVMGSDAQASSAVRERETNAYENNPASISSNANNNTQSAFGRPKTAGFMPEIISGQSRPQTGATQPVNGGGGRLPVKNSLKRFTPVGAGATRAISAGFSQN